MILFLTSALSNPVPASRSRFAHSKHTAPLPQSFPYPGDVSDPRTLDNPKPFC